MFDAGLVDATDRPDVRLSDAGFDELCNGVDDDRDGRVDEEIEPRVCEPPGPCSGVSRCLAGRFGPCEIPPPEPESCNGRDDDCDGATDEGLGFGPVGEIVELRGDTGGSDICTSCRWAFDTSLTPIDTGYLVDWRVGILGDSEIPNFYQRRIAPDGTPLGEVELPSMDVVLDVRYVGRSDHRAVLPREGVARVWRGDDPIWIETDRTGRTEIRDRPYTLGAGCRSANVGETVWTGERLVSVCWDEDAVFVASLAQDGTDVRNERIPLEGARGGNVAVYNGLVGVRTFVVRDRAERYVEFMLLDANGFVVVPPRRVDLEYASWARLIGTEAGWQYWTFHRGPTTWQQLSFEGDPLTEPQPFFDARRNGDAPYQDVQRVDESSSEFLNIWQSPYGEPDEDLHVEFIDAEGNIGRAWQGPLGERGGSDFHPHIGDDGNVRLVWHGSSEDRTINAVYFMELGCVP